MPLLNVSEPPPAVTPYIVTGIILLHRNHRNRANHHHEHPITVASARGDAYVTDHDEIRRAYAGIRPPDFDDYTYTEHEDAYER